MIEKYIITFGELTLALKYDPGKGKAVLGGYGRFRPEIEDIMVRYFAKEYKLIWTQRNKVRANFSIAPKYMTLYIAVMQEAGFVFEMVEKHGRIMR